MLDERDKKTHRMSRFAHGIKSLLLFYKTIPSFTILQKFLKRIPPEIWDYDTEKKTVIPNRAGFKNVYFSFDDIYQSYSRTEPFIHIS